MTDAASAPATPSSGLPARRVALDVLAATLDEGRAFDEALAAHNGFARLAPRDRAFARLLLTTTLRRLGEIEEMVGRCLERPLHENARPVMHALRLGAAQLLFLNVAPHAAVDTSVDLVAQVGHQKMRGLANAVLRRIGREGVSLLSGRDPARLNTPDWLWQSWAAAYGDAGARAIAAAHLIEAPLDLTARGDPATWAATLEAELLPTGTLRRAPGGLVGELPGYAEGAWWVQDAAAALPVRLLGDVKGLRVLDLCAAPGGKTMQLAAAGARVSAIEISRRRLDRVQENLKRVQLAAETVVADASRWRPPQPADAVLLDAPCTATGTLRRHPDIAWLKGPEEVDRMVLVQDRLLANAAQALKVGGRLVYAVCSLQPEEGEARIAAALRTQPLERDPVTADELPGLAEALTPRGDVRTLPSMWPERGGIDGFYIARLRRK